MVLMIAVITVMKILLDLESTVVGIVHYFDLIICDFVIFIIVALPSSFPSFGKSVYCTMLLHLSSTINHCESLIHHCWYCTDICL